MALTYPVDPESRYALYQISTGLILKRNLDWYLQVSVDGMPPGGLDPDLVYLKHVNQAVPQYDARLFHLVGGEEVDVDNSELRRTYSVQSNPADDIKVEIRNEEQVRFGRIARIEEALSDVYMMVVAVAAVVKDNQAFHPKAAAMYPDMLANAVKLYKNRNRREQLEAAADAGTVTAQDLDVEWEDV